MVLDSSVLLEILLNQSLSSKCEKIINTSNEKHFIPAIAYYEVYKKLRSQVSESDALEAVTVFEEYEIIALNKEIALFAADLSLEHQLGMADSIVLAMAREKRTTLLTLDNDFSAIPSVQVVRG